MDEGLVSLGGYLKFWGWIYILVTVWLAKYKKEVCPLTIELITGTNAHGRWRGKSSVPNDLVNLQIATCVQHQSVLTFRRPNTNHRFISL